jgi:hypothetical protein
MDIDQLMIQQGSVTVPSVGPFRGYILEGNMIREASAQSPSDISQSSLKKQVG